MTYAPSKTVLEQLVIDLCRATVALRIADPGHARDNQGKRARLAGEAGAWLSLCEIQIASLNAKPAVQARTNVIDLAARRASAGCEVKASPDGRTTPRQFPPGKKWAELRDQMRTIAETLEAR